MLDSTYTGIAFFVPNGDVPPTRKPECRFATSGLHGSMRFAPVCRARFFVDTVRSPCMRTMSGFACSSSITSVLTTTMLVHAELPRGFLRAAVLDIIVGMLAELDLVTAQELRRGRFGHVFGFRHGRIVAARRAAHHRPSGRLRSNAPPWHDRSRTKRINRADDARDAAFADARARRACKSASSRCPSGRAAIARRASPRRD